MNDLGNLPVTRSAWLELKGERELMQEGYEFLDEKRMIIATELQRQLRAYRDECAQMETRRREAAAALGLAAARHGFDGLTVYPAAGLRRWSQARHTSRFLGVELFSAGEVEVDQVPSTQPAPASHEAEHCRDCYAALVELAGRVALRVSNLRRLIAEYVRTERRARALENVLLPDVERKLEFLDDQLEAIDREESLRVRFADSSRG